MEPQKKRKFESAIILIKKLENGQLVVVDANTTIMFLNVITLTTLSGFKAKIEHLRYKTRVVDFSGNGEYFATISADLQESRLYSTTTRAAITKITRHHGEVSCVGIDKLNKYMYSCGDDGKTFAIDLKSGKVAFTLPVHVDTVNDIAFSDNGNWLATGSYDRKVSIFNLAMMTPKHKLKTSSPVMKLEFLTANKLLSIGKNNIGTIYNIYSGKTIAILRDIHDDVTQIAKSLNGKFLFIGTVLGYILVYELETYTRLSRKYIKLDSSITSLLFDDDTNELIIGTQNAEILIYNIFYGEEKIKEMLQRKEFDAIQRFVEDNPILAFTKIYQLVINLWDTTLEKAKRALENNDKDTALSLFKHFKDIPSKNKIIQKVLVEYEEYSKFVDLTQQGKLALAYGLASKHPLYRESKIFKALEAQWKKTFIIAQKYALDPKSGEKARDILAPYRGINEKTKMIQELLAQSEVYKRFRVAMGQKEFVVAFELIKQHQFLVEFPEYETLMNYADTIYIKSQELLNMGDTHAAIKLLRILRDFPDFEEEVKEMMLNIDLRQKFFNAISEENIDLAYNIMAKYEDLVNTDEGKALQEQWNNDLNKANAYAVEGDVKGIVESISAYMKIRSKIMSIGTVFAWCYMVQLENALKQKKDRIIIERGIKNYISSFGLQDHILSFYEIFTKYYKDSKLNLELQPQGSLSMWRPSMIVNSILD